MPDPTNPNPPAQSGAAPGWDQFVNQYYRAPQGGLLGMLDRLPAPTYTNPMQGGAGFAGAFGRRQENPGWTSLLTSGLLNQYGISNQGDWMQATRNQQDGVALLQQAFRDWQLQQMQQQQQSQPQQTPSEVQAVQPQQTPAQILSAFSQAAPVNNPPPLGTYASLLAAMNTPAPPQPQQADPLSSWIMQYLRG